MANLFEFINLAVKVEKVAGVFRFPTVKSCIKFMLRQEMTTPDELNNIIKEFMKEKMK